MYGLHKKIKKTLSFIKDVKLITTIIKWLIPVVPIAEHAAEFECEMSEIFDRAESGRWTAWSSIFSVFQFCFRFFDQKNKNKKHEPDSSIKLVFVSVGSVRSLLEEDFETIYLNLNF